MITLRPMGAGALALLVLALVGLARVPELLVHPILWNEDALILLPRCFAAAGAFSCAWEPHAGYVSLAPGLVAWAATLAPLGWTPHLYLAAAALANAAAAAVLLLPRAAPVLGPLPVRSLMALLLAAAPVGSVATAASLMHVNWPLLLLAVLLTALPWPKGRPAGVATAAALGLSLWTQPLAVLCLPILALRALRPAAPWEQAGCLVVILTGLGYLSFGIAGRPGSGGSGLVAATLAGLELVGTRAVLEALVGADLMALAAATPVLRGCLAVAGWGFLVGATVLAWRGGGVERRRFVAVATGMIVLLTLASVVARDLGAVYGIALRYFLVPKLLFLLLCALVVADRILARPGRSGVAVVVLLAALVVLLPGNRWYRPATFTDPQRGERLAAFLAAVEAADDRSGVLAVFPDRRNIFDLVLRRPPEAAPALPREIGAEARDGFGWFVAPSAGPAVEEWPGARQAWERAAVLSP